ncbi:predicted protein [Scheffersomyces stipitis CBS 6054]|uniref:Pyridoxal phosphate homeostasis protein n=1 Tax=Scheffersomyces stipitis (strain ATCC 58785 / CBS 6054 / NBRC 10063 / NRRL Y-11545) TaxID=322104 RepID=A3LWT3_PICST|nr:predicted protein [Scheffersomyces stipitis CBS 6054]ABN67694.1 predicted protein [Scheffersomyces stipitis CBS 6054]KAG2732553.1 hypothetical protein G9P44_004970 [Scheffersomyces stipitis]
MSSAFLQVSAKRQRELVANYNTVLEQVQSLAKKHSNVPVRLVAVSKLKPSGDIMALYNAGVRHFGENYVQELIGKSKELPKDIKWHFIGGMQSGKAKDLAKGVESLFAVETIDALKKCKQLDNTRSRLDGAPIEVYLQINTSEEDQKSGYSLSNLTELYETIDYILSDECKKLKLGGLMTIGSFAESHTDGEENEDFSKLVNLKKIVDEKYKLNLQLSMGMSSDFEQAIKQGSTSVRVGTSIFGARPPRI